MNAAVSSRSGSDSKNWWSLSSKSSSSTTNNDIRNSTTGRFHGRLKPPSALKFNNLVHAIGFKSKKQPSSPFLAIQEPPQKPIIIPSISTAPAQLQYANRPPSKSVSSTLRTEESLSPPTPSDINKDRPSIKRESLFTLSDDPFAARLDSLHQDAKCLSPRIIGKHDSTITFDSHSSHTSSSSNSRLSSFSSNRVPVTKDNAISFRSRCNSVPKSMHPPLESTILSNESMLSVDGRARNVITKSSSSSTLTDKNCTPNGSFSQKNIPPRPKASSIPNPSPDRSSFSLSSASASKHTSFLGPNSSAPRQVVRKVSNHRLTLPSAAPPPENLPPPPPPPPPDGISNSYRPISIASSTSMAPKRQSVASGSKLPAKSSRVISRTEDFTAPVIDEDWIRDFVPLSLHHPRTDSIPRSLKKSISHQSFGKNTPTSVPYSSSSHPSTPLLMEFLQHREQLPRSIRKPRSLSPSGGLHSQFLPHRGAPPSFGMSASQMENFAPVEGSPNRKSGPAARPMSFFNGSSTRPAMAPTSSMADDSLSSVNGQHSRERSDSLASSRSIQPSPIVSTFWEEEPPPGTDASTHEYTPQHIISPAEMLKLEAKVQAESEVGGMLSRGGSITSISTRASMMSGNEIFLEGGTSSRNSSPRKARTRSGVLSLQPPGSLRSSASQGSRAPSPPIPNFKASAFSLRPVAVSLPPPPRVKPGPQSQSSNPCRSSILVPLSPPPVRRSIVLANQSFEPAAQSRSIARKPSFLHIGDDLDDEGDEPLSSSFLDLKRESLETVRSFGDCSEAF